MQQVKRRIVLGITTGGLLAGGGLGFAHADASGTNDGGANGGSGTGHSPGFLSGNTIQIPVDVPINVCGLTANVIGLLNPAAGNDCSNTGGATADTSASNSADQTGSNSGSNSGTSTGTSTQNSGGASATGSSHGSPGILSGNTVQIPVHVGVNACGDTVNVVGVKNSAHDNTCTNGAPGSGSAPGQTGGSTATGSSSHSPGVVSGNTVQLPIEVPVNACGDTVNVVGVKDSAFDNTCTNGGAPGTSPGGSTATGTSTDSPGVGSGNTVQLPIDVPVNACGDTVNVIGILDSAHNNTCSNGGPGTPTTSPSTPPSTPSTPPSSPSTPPSSPTTPSSNPSTSELPPPPPPPSSSTPTTPGSSSSTPSVGGSTTPGGPGGTTPGGNNPGGSSIGALAHTGANIILPAGAGATLVGGGLALYRRGKRQAH